MNQLEKQHIEKQLQEGRERLAKVSHTIVNPGAAYWAVFGGIAALDPAMNDIAAAWVQGRILAYREWRAKWITSIQEGEKRDDDV